MISKVAISGICERDLDLLLLEELVASSAFRTWVAQVAGLGPLDHTVSPAVRRSVTHYSGESDLEVDLVLADGQRVTILIENKVDASLQTEQAERYKTRGQAYVCTGKCELARTLVVAPLRYFGNDLSLKGFDARLTYEELKDWFANQPALAERGAYKCTLLAAAIEKATLGYQPIADAAMTDFWQLYSSWVTREAPELNMPESKGRPAGSTHVYFRPDGFAKQLWLVHKFQKGHVDLEFARWGHRLAELRELIGSVPPNCSLEKAAKSAALRSLVPKLDIRLGAAQEEAAVAGIRAARELLNWYRTNREILTKIVESTVSTPLS